jgi:Cu/Zn superoxide dismutase
MSSQSRAVRRVKRVRSVRAWLRLGAVAVSALAATLALVAPASASTSSATAARQATDPAWAAHLLPLNAMPVGTVAFGRDRRNHLTVSVEMYGLTPGSSHRVNLLSSRGYFNVIRFSTLTANSVGQARATLSSSYTGPWLRGTQLVIHMGTGHGSVARQRIAETGVLGRFTIRPHLLTSVEYSYTGVSYGTPRGVATISYNSRRKTLTVTVNASGVTPGLHAAHIHLGSCMSQGPVKYMLKDLPANSQGKIVHAVRVFTNVTTPIPPSGWYLNIHQGNSNQILSNGNPTIYFRPLLCADISGS